MTDTAEQVKARVRAALAEVPLGTMTLRDHIEKALDEPKPTLRERVAEVLRQNDEPYYGTYGNVEGRTYSEIADAVLACIAEGALGRYESGKWIARDSLELDPSKGIAAVLEVDPSVVT